MSEVTPYSITSFSLKGYQGWVRPGHHTIDSHVDFKYTSALTIFRGISKMLTCHEILGDGRLGRRHRKGE